MRSLTSSTTEPSESRSHLVIERGIAERFQRVKPEPTDKSTGDAVANMRSNVQPASGTPLPSRMVDVLVHNVASLSICKPILNTIDGLPVRIVALVVSHPSRNVEHIQSLGRVSRFLGDATTRSTLMNATASDIARMIRAEDE